MKRRGEQFAPPSGKPQGTNMPAAMTGQLFDTAPHTKPEPRMDYEPEAWIGRRDVSFHSSSDWQMPQEANDGSTARTAHTGYGFGFHHGTLGAAMERGRITAYSHIDSDDFHSYMSRSHIHPLRMSGEVALRPEAHNEDVKARTPEPGKRDYYTEVNKRPLVFADSEANVSTDFTGARPPEQAVQKHIQEGRHIPYVNAAEDVGSISFRSPRSALHTWGEDVRADPGASRHHQLLAEQFDLTIPVHENWEQRLGRPKYTSVQTQQGEMAVGPHPTTKAMPESLSGQAHEQGTLFSGVKGSHLYPARGSGSEPSGQSNLPLMQPRMVRQRALDVPWTDPVPDPKVG